MADPNQLARATRNKRLSFKLFLWVLVMFAFGYALVPFYDVMCRTLGINGKTNDTMIAAADSSLIDPDRVINLQLIATNNSELPWLFRPKQHQISVHPGQNKRIAYFAKNLSDKPMTIQAVPSVAPSGAAKYLIKTECFCFEQQTLKPGESIDMPILFHFDPSLPKEFSTVTLSYTIFDTNGPTKNVSPTLKQEKSDV